jgi:hypothetical protein
MHPDRVSTTFAAPADPSRRAETGMAKSLDRLAVLLRTMD